MWRANGFAHGKKFVARDVKEVENAIKGRSHIVKPLKALLSWACKSFKEVLHFGHQLPYFLTGFVHYLTLKTLQPGHWEVKEFFTQY